MSDKIRTVIKKNVFLYTVFSCLKKIGIKILCTFAYMVAKEQGGSNEKLIILGNGPSLKNDIMKIIPKRYGYTLMAVNSYFLDGNFPLLKPELYALADPSYFDDAAVGIGLADRDLFIEKIRSTVSWNMTLILPNRARKSLLARKVLANSFITIAFINVGGQSPFFVNKFKAFNKNISTPHCQNVLQLCLYYGIWQRYKNIYLFGADHNWCRDITVTDDNVVAIEEKHCYAYEHDKVHPMEKTDGTHFTMGELFAAWTRVYAGYYVLNDYAGYNGVEVFNESSVSFIDAFKRKSGRF